MSKGKYLEFHDLDSIVTIGSVRFNVYKNQIVGHIVQDTLNPDAQPIGDVTGRWMSPDPLSEEFPEWSPYTMSFDDPIKFVDPDGRAPLDYFDKETGKYLGKGGTDEIRLISKSDWDKGNLNNYSTKGKYLSDVAAKNIVSHYIQFTDKKIEKNVEVKINNNLDLSAKYDEKADKIVLNFPKEIIGGTIENRYDMINMHEHETFSHGNDHVKLWKNEHRKYERSKDGVRFEQNAVNYQVRTSSWNKTSYEFKETLYNAGYNNYISISDQNKYFIDVIKKLRK
ncbi:hypothetical protein NHF50_01010 [Flavobacterium sp. NRK F10]|uniref:hypothetical protein n=1 Tax=Flavobacterium sp. NRK F10 TaxID=2954931 RepID=UPI00209034D6|nr:hypothetical protein [Flavobacterium sp. NRK F10]MCO6173615.1 hypothetical protein [Flavobacterium sp. NRK F10]